MSLLKCNVAGVYIFEPGERRYTPDGKELAQVRGSVSRKKGDGYENTTVDLVMWEPDADSLIWQLNKGDRVNVEGTFWPRAYLSKKDGEAKATLNITVTKIERDSYAGSTASTNTDDVPF